VKNATDDTLTTFVAEGRAVHVRASTPEATRYVSRLLPSYVVSGSGRRTDPVYTLAAIDDAWVLGTPDGTDLQYESIGDALNELEHYITRELLASLSRYTHLHASGALADGGAVLALGASGAGKSSLAIHWFRSGLPVFGDDIVLVDSTGLAHSFERLFDVHPSLLEELGEGPDSELTAISNAEGTWFDPAIDGGWAPAAPIVRLAIVRYSDGADVIVRPLEKPEVLAALMASTMPTGVGTPGAFDRLVAVSESAEGLDVTFGSAREAAHLLADL
jgi:hypothetical protein